MGVYDKSQIGFVISRFKFKANYLFTEYHWDIGDIKPDFSQWATVKPLKDLGPILPMDDEAELRFLNEKAYEIKALIEDMYKDSKWPITVDDRGQFILKDSL